MERFLSVPGLLYEKRGGWFSAFCSAVPLKLCPTAEISKLLQAEDRFGLRGSSSISDGKEHPAWQLPCSYSAVTLGKTSISAFCWFYVVIGLGSEFKDHSMRSCSCEKESILELNMAKYLIFLMELSLKKTLIQLLFAFPYFDKNYWRQKAGKLFLKTWLITTLFETVIFTWNFSFPDTLNSKFCLESVYHSASDSHKLP